MDVEKLIGKNSYSAERQLLRFFYQKNIFTVHYSPILSETPAGNYRGRREVVRFSRKVHTRRRLEMRPPPLTSLPAIDAFGCYLT